MFNFLGDSKAVQQQMAEFEKLATAWKPSGYNVEAARRLRFYLDQQVEDTKEALRERFPNTYSEIVPITVPLTTMFVNELAKVFLDETRFVLRDSEKGEDLDGEEDDRAIWWKETQDKAGLHLRLKNVDRYTQLLRTAFLKVNRIGSRLHFQPFFPQAVEIAFDPSAPFDLDRAFGVRLEIAAEAGAAGQPGKRLWEFYCARPGSETFLLIDSEGNVQPGTPEVALARRIAQRLPVPDDVSEPKAGGYPFWNEDGHAVVPLVMFTAHTEELGPFTLANQGIAAFNAAINVAASDLQHIMESLGYGQLVIETAAGMKPPTKVLRGPNRAIVLPEGNKANMLAPSANLTELVSYLQAAIKQEAVLRGIPAGAVSVEARAVASGVALTIEMRPLLEARKDSVQAYAAPIDRLWSVTRVVHNATRDATDEDEPEIPPTIELRWEPGDVSMPADPKALLDAVVVEIKEDLCTRAEAIARLRKIPLAEAKELAERIAEENAEARTSRMGELTAVAADGITAAANAGVPPAPGQKPEDEEEPPAKPAPPVA